MFKYQWTNGTIPERSSRKREKNISLPYQKSKSEDQIQNQIVSKVSQSSIYSQNAPQLTPAYQSYLPTPPFVSTEDNIKQREDTCIKMGEREIDYFLIKEWYGRKNHLGTHGSPWVHMSPWTPWVPPKGS